MAKLAAFFRRLLGQSSARTPRSYGQTIDPDYSVFQEGDKFIRSDRHGWRLSNRLVRDGTTATPHGNLNHNDIIGKKTRELVRSHTDNPYRITVPSLDEYVTSTFRLVTPIYPADANLIVSLLDIHASRPSPGQNSAAPLEILEAGTGHGSLTLHLARAVHAANTTPPPFPLQSQVKILGQEATESKTNAPTEAQKDTSAKTQVQQEWDSWRAQRGAVIHTVDVKHHFSVHAEKIVRGFRRGMYTGEVDFYTSPVEDWIAEQTRRRTSGRFIKKVHPFLSYVILDMPSAHKRMPQVAPIMKADGILAVFMPNITQIADCSEILRRQRLPFIHEKTVELGTGISSGRLWDVKFTLKKAASNSAGNRKRAVEDENQTDPGEGTSDSEPDLSGSSEKSEDDRSVLSCRPKVGERIVGGGFVAIFRRFQE